MIHTHTHTHRIPLSADKYTNLKQIPESLQGERRREEGRQTLEKGNFNIPSEKIDFMSLLFINGKLYRLFDGCLFPALVKLSTESKRKNVKITRLVVGPFCAAFKNAIPPSDCFP